MVCGITCLVSLIMVFAMVYMMSAIQSSGIAQKYQAQLPPDLQDVYKKIADERARIYYFGYSLGFVLAAVIIIYNVRVIKNKLPVATMVCLAVVVSFLTSYFYYILTPKTAWMLESIKSPDQTEAWLKMYRGMQVYYHSGIVLGTVAVGVFALSFRCSLK
jgi:hypothetical protein